MATAPSNSDILRSMIIITEEILQEFQEKIRQQLKEGGHFYACVAPKTNSKMMIRLEFIEEDTQKCIELNSVSAEASDILFLKALMKTFEELLKEGDHLRIDAA